MEASWYKLKSGDWGCKIRVAGQPGDQVALVNKKGEKTNVWLKKQVAKFDDAELWTFTDKAPADEPEIEF